MDGGTSKRECSRINTENWRAWLGTKHDGGSEEEVMFASITTISKAVRVCAFVTIIVIVWGLFSLFSVCHWTIIVYPREPQVLEAILPLL